MLVHIYIYEYIFPLYPLWLDLKIEKKIITAKGKKEWGKILCYSWGKLLLTLRERERKTSAHFKSNTLGYCFCNQKTRFFFHVPSPSLLLFFSPCIYNTYRTRLLNCEDRAGSSLWCKRSWNATPRRSSWVWGIKRKWEGGIKKK